MDFSELNRSRYSCRSFSDRKIDDELLNSVLKEGLIAPTAKNNQPFRIYILDSEEAIKKVDEVTSCRYKAKTVLLFTYKKDEEWVSPLDEGITSGIQDASIVATTIMLKAKDAGLDTCWVCYFENRKLKKLLNLEESEECVLLMPIGYASASASPSPRHYEKRDFNELVKKL